MNEGVRGLANPFSGRYTTTMSKSGYAAQDSTCLRITDNANQSDR